MNLSFFIAKRYFFSKKRSIINIISGISVVGVLVGTAALIIVLSVFNGFQGLLEGLFSVIEPDIKIEAAKGKNFLLTDKLIQKVQANENVKFISPTIEGNGVIKYQDKQAIVHIKGIHPDFLKVSEIDSFVYEGKFIFNEKPAYTMLGGGVAYKISAIPYDVLEPMRLYVPSKKMNVNIDPSKALKMKNVITSGFFSLQKEYDDKYVFVDYTLAESLFDQKGKASAIEIKLKKGADLEKTQAELKSILGKDFQVKTWYELHETLFKITKNEKKIGYIILTFMLIIAGSNIVGSLSMVVIEKKRDVGILKAMGASKTLIQNIFLLEGLLVSSVGLFFGMLIAYTFCYLQINYGFIKLNGGETFVVEAFPLAVKWEDFVLIFVTVMTLSLLSGYLPARKAAQWSVIDAIKK